MKQLKLAVLPGDGIGQEVTWSSIPIFEALNIPVEMFFGDIGWEYWKNEGNPIPERTWELIKSTDATLLGATTSKPEREALKELSTSLQASSPRYTSPIIQLRQELDLYANVRPCYNIKDEAEDFKFSIIRENTEGLYAGLDFYPLSDPLLSVIAENPRWQHLAKTDAACSLRLQSHAGLSRLFKYAFEYAEREKFTRVTFADKPNVLRKSSAFAREIFENVAQQYPHIKADIHNVDAVALWMVKRPAEFGVIVAENMFGDILSDLGAGIMGGLGFAASANIGKNGCYFEPVHGSAPRVKSNTANPSAMFLTIALLLENFGFITESEQIKKAVKEVVKEGKNITYDLGGEASTQAMAKAIIDRCLHPKERKMISFLSTGNEIIQGELQDSNGHSFAKVIHKNNGDIYQHIQVSDKKHEISAALKYLLNKSDAVVVTGGLGPTSDDRTRFAIAEVTGSQLAFDETAWSHVVKRLKSFNLPITDANRQQALFPVDAKLYPNTNGTAFGCELQWKNKYIFMLPGPPKECHPLFEQYVLPILREANFFSTKKTLSWLTLGLIEGEIAPQIDEIAKSYSAEMAYRWNYPYLEIKFTYDSQTNVEVLSQEIEKLISPYLVSHSGQGAFEVLYGMLDKLADKIYLIDNITSAQFSKEILHSNLLCMENTKDENSKRLLFVVSSSKNLSQQQSFSGTVTFTSEGYIDGKQKFIHQMSIPNRGPEVIEYAKCYIAWQMSQFIRTCEVSYGINATSSAI